MNTYPLKIVTPDGLLFDGDAEKLIVRTTAGDMAVLAGHVDCVAVLSPGRTAVVDSKGQQHMAFCENGLLSVQHGRATLISGSFRWDKPN